MLASEDETGTVDPALVGDAAGPKDGLDDAESKLGACTDIGSEDPSADSPSDVVEITGIEQVSEYSFMLVRANDDGRSSRESDVQDR